MGSGARQEQAGGGSPWVVAAADRDAAHHNAILNGERLEVWEAGGRGWSGEAAKTRRRTRVVLPRAWSQGSQGSPALTRGERRVACGGGRVRRSRVLRKQPGAGGLPVPGCCNAGWPAAALPLHRPQAALFPPRTGKVACEQEEEGRARQGRPRPRRWRVRSCRGPACRRTGGPLGALRLSTPPPTGLTQLVDDVHVEVLRPAHGERALHGEGVGVLLAVDRVGRRCEAGPRIVHDPVFDRGLTGV
jgi:hypothetical protein